MLKPFIHFFRSTLTAAVGQHQIRHTQTYRNLEMKVFLSNGVAVGTVKDEQEMTIQEADGYGRHQTKQRRSSYKAALDGFQKVCAEGRVRIDAWRI